MAFGDKLGINDNADAQLQRERDEADASKLDRYKHEHREAIIQAIFTVEGRPARLQKARIAHLWDDRFQADFFCEVDASDEIGDDSGFGLSNKLINYGIVPRIKIRQSHFIRFDGEAITYCNPPLKRKAD